KSVIEYPHATTGSTVRLEVNNSTSTATLNNIAAEQSFSIYTLYTPTNCMDQMQSATKSYSTPAAPTQPSGSTLEIKVMQLNVATGNALTALVGASHVWNDRVKKIAAMIKDNNIDIVGFQELRDSPNYYYSNIMDQLGSSYSGVCYARSSSYDKEGLAIVYRNDKFELVSQGRYWLNMTDPDKELKLSSGGYEANFYRIAVYAILREKSTGQEFYFTTAHLDNNDAGSGIIKTWQAQILINHTNARSGYDNGANRFLIVTGDMNSNPEREAMQRFTSSAQNYKDTWTEAENRYRPSSDIPRSTMVDIDGNNATQNYACFDYIFVKGGNPRVVSHTIHEAKSGNIVMSDHNAVSAVLQYQISK
ncbi:MAG: endonuclease/exonuclease/phosphatase family protein, partial [Alistipes sp.]|nr:endonuclease/exonuclease/phosphatase family protein [Alistipes sp.]